MCREEALEIAERFRSGEYTGAQLIGVIKEVAPVSGAETDEILGVGEFQHKYFLDYPVYMDAERKFYALFGNKSLLAQPLHSWNPFTLYSDFQTLGARLKAKGVTGNLKGEGLLKGGVMIVSAAKGVQYIHEEMTGHVMPYDDFKAALDGLEA